MYDNMPWPFVFMFLVMICGTPIAFMIRFYMDLKTASDAVKRVCWNIVGVFGLVWAGFFAIQIRDLLNAPILTFLREIGGQVVEIQVSPVTRQSIVFHGVCLLCGVFIWMGSRVLTPG